MENLEALAAKILSDIYALPEEKMRLGLLGRTLSGLKPEDIARVLDIMFKKDRVDASARCVRSMLVDPRSLKSMLGADVYRRTYLVSLKLGLKKVSRYFTDIAPRKAGQAGYDKEEEARMEFMTLGQRRAMSKSSVKDTLDRLLSDPDPVVVNNLLNNPRMTEKDVLKIASKRPNSPEILRLLSGHRVWSKRYAVIKAIVLNPYTPPRISVALLDSMLVQDLKLVAGDSTVHPQTKLGARELLEERTGGSG